MRDGKSYHNHEEFQVATISWLLLLPTKYNTMKTFEERLAKIVPCFIPFCRITIPAITNILLCFHLLQLLYSIWQYEKF